jgi:hypothetical protein
MAGGQEKRVFEFLTRREDPARVLTFIRNVSEGYWAAFADSARTVPGEPADRSAVCARGTLRRHLMDKAIRNAAIDSGYALNVGRTEPPTWSFPLVRIGAFSLTVGIVDRLWTRGAYRLRGRGRYVRAHAERNSPLNPQPEFFDAETGRVTRIIPRGSFGALLVAEPSVHLPDLPLFVGFLVLSPDLKETYFRCSLDQLLEFLHSKVAASRLRKRPVIRRKRPTLRTRRNDPPGGK